MEPGDAGDALSAHAEQPPAEERDTEARALAEADDPALPPGPLVFCPRCNATWTVDAVTQARRRRAVCLMCGGPLTPIESE